MRSTGHARPRSRDRAGGPGGRRLGAGLVAAMVLLAPTIPAFGATLLVVIATEAGVLLPIDGEAIPEALFAGLEWRRLRVRQDQGAPEWVGA